MPKSAGVSRRESTTTEPTCVVTRTSWVTIAASAPFATLRELCVSEKLKFSSTNFGFLDSNTQSNVQAPFGFQSGGAFARPPGGPRKPSYNSDLNFQTSTGTSPIKRW